MGLTFHTRQKQKHQAKNARNTTTETNSKPG